MVQVGNEANIIVYSDHHDWTWNTWKLMNITIYYHILWYITIELIDLKWIGCPLSRRYVVTSLRACLICILLINLTMWPLAWNSWPRKSAKSADFSAVLHSNLLILLIYEEYIPIYLIPKGISKQMCSFAMKNRQSGEAGGGAPVYLQNGCLLDWSLITQFSLGIELIPYTGW